MKDGGQIGLWDHHGGLDQRWKYNGHTQHIYSEQTNKVFDIRAGCQDNGTKCQVWEADSSD